MRQEHVPIVRELPRLGIRAALTISLALTAASAVLGAAGMFAYQLHKSGRQAERLRILAMAEVYAAQVAGAIAPTSDGGVTEGSGVSAFPNADQRATPDLRAMLQNWNWHPGSRFLAVLDQDGIPVAMRGDRAILDQWLTLGGTGPDASSQTGTRLLSGDRELFLPDVAAAAAPIILPGATRSLGTLLYAARTTGARSLFQESFWKYLAAVLAISGAGLVMGFCLLRHSLLEPLKALLRQGRMGTSTAPRTIERGDEIGALAALLEDLNVGLGEWRERAAHLEASVDRRVHDQTREVAIQLRQVEERACIDPLTRLANRRFLDEEFGRLFTEYRQSGMDLAVVMIDVDYFKTLNDTLGHKAGDELIGFIGDLLRQCVRGADQAVRYGGDEFLLIFPGATSAQAAKAAERVIRLFGQRARLLSVQPRPSMSAGVASLKEHRPATAPGLLQMADQALYRAKSLGKSQVSVYQPGTQTHSAGLRLVKAR